MSRCRVASRVGAITPAHIACIQGESASTFAAKVCPFQLPPSPPSRPGRPGRASYPRLRSADVGAGGGGGAAAGRAAWGCVGGDGRRVASKLTPAPTPSPHSATAANERGNGGEL
jgi:hypothetical protein